MPSINPTVAPGYAIAAAGGDIPARLRRDTFGVYPLPGGFARVARMCGGYEVLLPPAVAARFSENQAAHRRGLDQIRAAQAAARKKEAAADRAAAFSRRAAGDTWGALDKLVQ